MSHAEICPVCSGKGKVEEERQCHGCAGLGWITVGVDLPYVVPSVWPDLQEFPGWYPYTYIDSTGTAGTFYTLEDE